MDSFSLSDQHQPLPTFGLPRLTWILVLASAVPLYALPLLFQAMYEARGWPACYEIRQIQPGAILEGTWWLREILLCCTFLVIAGVAPRWLHARWLSRVSLPLVEGALGAVGSYRRPAERRFLVDARGVRAVTAAYYARLAAVLVLLLPAVVWAYCIALPVRGWGSVMPPSITFSSPEEYMPVFVAATMILLLNAPTEATLLGPRIRAFRGGIVRRHGGTFAHCAIEAAEQGPAPDGAQSLAPLGAAPLG